MTDDVLELGDAIAGGAVCAHDVLTRAAARFQSWFHGADQEQLNREQNLRLEERHKERARIARELHDTLFQGFLCASMQLHNAVEQLPSDSPSQPSLSRALSLIQRVLDEGRLVLQGLRSSGVAPETLEQALSNLRDELPPGGSPFRIFVRGNSRALKPDVRQETYQIGREALLNALRHSGAGSIEVEIEYLPSRLRVVVRDNGRGIDSQIVRSGRDGHWGLLAMRERAASIGAKLRVWSKPGRGTEVEVCVPAAYQLETCA